MRTLWSNSRERMENYEKRKDAGISYPEGLVILLKETAKRNRPTSETADSPENTPQDHDIRQCERVLEFQNRDFWIRPNRFVLALSHTTLREMPFKNFRGTSSENQKSEITRLRKSGNGTHRLGLGSHITRGNEIIFIDPHKGIQDDENNVCL